MSFTSSTPPLAQRLADPKAEAVRANMQQQLDELRAFATAADLSGRLLNRQLLTGTGTYTPTLGTRLAIVRMVGGGGGGGGAKGVAAKAGAAGGHSGWYLDFKIRSSTSGDITGGAFGCGAGGTAGAATPTDGGNGGDTSVTINGRTYLAKGGTGGKSTTDGDGIPAAALAGSTLANVDLFTYGPGGAGSGTAEISGVGGSIAPFGAGGASVNGVLVSGNPGQGFGAGGSGAAADSDSGSGGAGAPGAILIEEYS